MRSLVEYPAGTPVRRLVDGKEGVLVSVHQATPTLPAWAAVDINGETWCGTLEAWEVSTP